MDLVNVDGRDGILGGPIMPAGYRANVLRLVGIDDLDPSGAPDVLVDHKSQYKQKVGLIGLFAVSMPPLALPERVADGGHVFGIVERYLEKRRRLVVPIDIATRDGLDRLDVLSVMAVLLLVGDDNTLLSFQVGFLCLKRVMELPVEILEDGLALRHIKIQVGIKPPYVGTYGSPIELSTVQGNHGTHRMVSIRSYFVLNVYELELHGPALTFARRHGSDK